MENLVWHSRGTLSVEKFGSNAPSTSQATAGRVSNPVASLACPIVVFLEPCGVPREGYCYFATFATAVSTREGLGLTLVVQEFAPLHSRAERSDASSSPIERCR